MAGILQTIRSAGRNSILGFLQLSLYSASESSLLDCRLLSKAKVKQVRARLCSLSHFRNICRVLFTAFTGVPSDVKCLHTLISMVYKCRHSSPSCLLLFPEHNLPNLPLEYKVLALHHHSHTLSSYLPEHTQIRCKGVPLPRPLIKAGSGQESDPFSFRAPLTKAYSALRFLPSHHYVRSEQFRARPAYGLAPLDLHSPSVEEDFASTDYRYHVVLSTLPQNHNSK